MKLKIDNNKIKKCIFINQYEYHIHHLQYAKGLNFKNIMNPLCRAIFIRLMDDDMSKFERLSPKLEFHYLVFFRQPKKDHHIKNKGNNC
jgi:hypothetical protein